MQARWKGLSPHQGSCHIIKPLSGAPKESKPIIIKQIVAHDVIIKELNVQGGKASVQSGMIMHHISE
jgi:hypothetical protein